MKHPLPRTKKSSDRYWSAAAKCEFQLPYCPSCSCHHWPPVESCRTCDQPVEWRHATGAGFIETYSVIRRAVIPILKDCVPYVVAFVRLEEGVLVFGNIVDGDIDELRPGQPVSVAFECSGDEAIGIPVFRPKSIDQPPG